MTNDLLAKSYLEKVEKQLIILPVLLNEGAYSNIVREAQEIVELALKAVLRQIGIEPPKWHDVGELILRYRDRLPKEVAENADKLAEISKNLRKDRELAFYGAEDFIPTKEYKLEDATRAMEGAEFVVGQAKLVISYRRGEV